MLGKNEREKSPGSWRLLTLAATFPYLKAKAQVSPALVARIPGPEISLSLALFNSLENVFRCLESQRDSLVKTLQFPLAAPSSRLKGRLVVKCSQPALRRASFSQCSCPEVYCLVLKEVILISFSRKVGFKSQNIVYNYATYLAA